MKPQHENSTKSLVVAHTDTAALQVPALVLFSWSSGQIKKEIFLADCPGVHVMSQEHAPSVQVTAKLTGGWARGDG